MHTRIHAKTHTDTHRRTQTHTDTHRHTHTHTFRLPLLYLAAPSISARVPVTAAWAHGRVFVFVRGSPLLHAFDPEHWRRTHSEEPQHPEGSDDEQERVLPEAVDTFEVS